MEPPPSYDQHGFDDNPPPYEGNTTTTTTTTNSNANPTPTDEKRPVAAEKSHPPPPSALVLDGCEISPEDNPSRVLYKTTDPPALSDPKVFQYGVQKRDVGRVYDFRADLVGLNVEVLGYADAAPAPSSGGGGQSSRQQKPRASPAFRMALGEDAATYHISAVGRQRAAPMAVMPLQDESGGIAWASAEGRLLAVEFRGGGGDGATHLPRLEIRDGGIAPHDLDLLVTCWCARIWNEKKLGDKGMSVRGASGLSSVAHFVLYEIITTADMLFFSYRRQRQAPGLEPRGMGQAQHRKGRAGTYHCSHEEECVFSLNTPFFDAFLVRSIG